MGAAVDSRTLVWNAHERDSIAKKAAMHGSIDDSLMFIIEVGLQQK